MRYTKITIMLLLLTFTFNIVGCASCIDPFEPINRKIFCFNMALDRAVMRPVAKAYDKVVPAPVACRISNFFDNIDDLTNIANNLLQLKLLDAWSDTWRFAFNTTFGVAGLFDVATCAGLPKHHQDFGLTLARYGFTNSTYMMIPFFGPSTIRDTIGWSVDWRYLSAWGYLRPNSVRYSLYGVRLVQRRACLLAADKLIDEALDPYVFVRDAYLQKRGCEIKAIAPHFGCDQAPAPDADAKASKKGDGDPFEPEGDDKKAKDADDPFVGEEDNQSVKKQAPTEGKQPTSSAKAKAGDDPFVAP